MLYSIISYQKLHKLHSINLPLLKSYKYINKRPVSVPCGVHQDLLTFTGDFFSGLGGEDSMAPPTTGVVLSRWCLAPALLDLILGVGIRPVSEGKSGVTSLLNGIFFKIVK